MAGPQPLILPAPEIVDIDALNEAIAAAAQEASAKGGDAAEIRAAVVPILREAMATGRKTIADAFTARPRAAAEMVRSYTYVTDTMVIATMRIAETWLAPLSPKAQKNPISLIAVGGYGRGDMAPFSDVDLLFLARSRMSDDAEALIEAMLYLLWDLKMKVGHSSRTIRDCLKLGADDFTIRTSMLEMRYLAGERTLADDLEEQLRAKLFSGTEREFVEAKLEERENRHSRQGERYMVEPNVKEGKGGLRDLQSLYWIAKYIHGVRAAAELVPLGVFRREEYETFRKAENFLWAVRGHLHLAAGRATEQLTFDMQVEVAGRMGYTDLRGRRAVEIFMQDYFRQATAVGDLTRIFIAKLEGESVRQQPLLERIFTRTPEVKEGYVVQHSRLAVEDPVTFLSDKLNILRLFEEGLRSGLLIHPDAMRLVTANLHLIDNAMRTDPEAQKIFLGLLLNHGNPERALRRMNELGVLSAFIPEFEPIVAMMQFNMYHSYTVDEHTIQCIAQLAMMEKGDLTETLPVATEILAGGVNRRVLYVALLCHDIGKGRAEDHSILGARIARTVAPRLGLDREECDTVEWLVRYHLLMSDTAQKRDIADPRTVRDFAKMVGSVRRLDLMTVLTVCDIRGVGPSTWNNWKAALLRALYRQTRRALEDGMEDFTRANRGLEAKKALRKALPDWPKEDLRVEAKRHYAPYWQGLHVTAHVVFARMLRQLAAKDDPSALQIHLYPDGERDATRACFAMVDHPGIFARLTGALALVGANVVDARSYTTKDGYVTSAFWIQDQNGRPYDADRLPRLEQMMRKTLGGEVVASRALEPRDKLKKREKAFTVATNISFNNDASDIYTLIEVTGRDRPGLLYDLARTLTQANVYIANAVIATYGEQVVDTFYVKDMFGLKYHARSKQRFLEARLREAIDEGAKRASE